MTCKHCTVYSRPHQRYAYSDHSQNNSTPQQEERPMQRVNVPSSERGEGETIGESGQRVETSIAKAQPVRSRKKI